jgi:hypothetical protein
VEGYSLVNNPPRLELFVNVSSKVANELWGLKCGRFELVSNVT